MVKRLRLDLAYDEATWELHKDKVRDYILPLYKHAVVINPDAPNEERGYVEVENCGHDEAKPCKIIARWEVGKGKVK